MDEVGSWYGRMEGEDGRAGTWVKAKSKKELRGYYPICVSSKQKAKHKRMELRYGLWTALRRSHKDCARKRMSRPPRLQARELVRRQGFGCGGPQAASAKQGYKHKELKYATLHG